MSGRRPKGCRCRLEDWTVHVIPPVCGAFVKDEVNGDNYCANCQHERHCHKTTAERAAAQMREAAVRELIEAASVTLTLIRDVDEENKSGDQVWIDPDGEAVKRFDAALVVMRAFYQDRP